MSFFEKIIAFMQTEMAKPTLFGWVHLVWIAVAIGLIVLVCFKCRNLTDKQFRIILLVVGCVLIVFEIFKQLNFAYDAATDTWDYEWKQFPFQFCSVPMYVMLFAAALKEGKLRDYLCSFLATFGLFAGLIVLLYPATVLSPVVFRFSQSMIHHIALLVIGVIMFVSGKVKIEHKTVLKAMAVFAGCVVIAFVMNVVYHATGCTDSFNMFYIGPHSKSDLPVFADIGKALHIEYDYVHIGNFVFVLLYIIAFSIAAYVVLLTAMLIKKICSVVKQKKQENV